MSTHKGTTNANKDVIYIDVDDEITAIIDKVRGSEKKIVALVLPKRATVLQSIVNMKLLRRASDESKKNLVLVTSEAGLMPLAGSVGIHVSKSLNSRPEVPDKPDRVDDKAEMVEEVEEGGDATVDKSKTVGELTGAPAVDDDSDETIELDNEDAAEDTDSDKKDAKVKPVKGKNKKFKIPNFNKFRVMLLLAVVGVLLLGSAAYAAFAVMPKAKITIKTDSTAVNSSSVLTLKTGPEAKLDAEKAIVPAQVQEVKKTLTQQVPATGQLNNGTKATGTVTIKNCTDNPVTIPAGTGVSASGLTFITKETLSLGSGNFTIGGICKTTGNHIDTTDVAAQSGGSKYNIAAQSYSIAGQGSGVTGSGSAMSGGTDNITKVVTQGDIDSAKQKIGEQDTEPVEQELKSALIGRDLFAIDASFSIGAPETKLSAQPNAPAENVTVTETITYTMLGTKQEDLEKVVEITVKDKIDTKKQSILNYGLDEAAFGLQAVNPDGVTMTLQTTVVAGAELDTNAIKKQVAGKKAGEAKQIISANPGVTDVTVDYSPFWVSSIPKNQNKIMVVVQEPKVTKDAADSP